MAEEGVLTSTVRHIRGALMRAFASTLFYSGMIDGLQSKAKRNLIKKISNAPRVFPFGVLLYHRVSSDVDPYLPGISSTVFDAQMAYLARNYKVLPLGEILRRMENGIEIEPYTVAITFDDGYRDNLTCAHPILKKYRLPATLFAATRYIGSKEAMWNDQVSWAFKRTTRKDFTFEVANQRRSLSLRSEKEKICTLGFLLEVLKEASDLEKSRIVDQVVTEFDIEKQSHPKPKLMLNWPELRQMVEEGWEVGSHTVNHVILTRVEETTAFEELRRSKEMLEMKLQRPIYLFAYPNGKQSDFDVTIKNLVRQAGYKVAVTTLDGLNDKSTDPFEIRRRSPWESHLSRFATNMLHLYWKEWKSLGLTRFEGRCVYEGETQ